MKAHFVSQSALAVPTEYSVEFTQQASLAASLLYCVSGRITSPGGKGCLLHISECYHYFPPQFRL